MNYTKGEWEVSRGGELMPECERIIQSVIGFDPPGVKNVISICHTWDNPGLDEAIANAHLIAAAPDMLEALKLLQAALTEYRLRDVKKRYSLCVADAAASKAIAKAEGK